MIDYQVVNSLLIVLWQRIMRWNAGGDSFQVRGLSGVYCLVWGLNGKVYVDNIGISVYNLQNSISMYVDVTE